MQTGGKNWDSLDETDLSKADLQQNCEESPLVAPTASLAPSPQGPGPSFFPSANQGNSLCCSHGSTLHSDVTDSFPPSKLTCPYLCPTPLASKQLID